MISEKGLIAAMSDAAKRGGYRIRFNEDEGTVVILTNEWLVNLETERLCRKQLALIVEHFGYIPESGCFEVTKHKDEFLNQAYMDEHFNKAAYGFASGTQVQAVNTGVTVWGRSLWAGEGGELRGIAPRLFNLLEAERKAMLNETALCFMDDDSAVFLAAGGGETLSDNHLIIWHSIENIDWWKVGEEVGEDSTEEDCPEQCQLEEALNDGD